ncbi:hepatitis A virus cellular receptor 1 homolog isoform X3 [Nerophis ophidion]|uniref:hepatitis A virus cellular receptor 1 homolog isoform X3 n=1 Tax=Nerophis ophidion TaxID=159077 RepID=UPI002ADF6027|nr:hepatitis A virus cellular receptor 1 homolog isoform X3 [Nerophis ophidion]
MPALCFLFLSILSQVCSEALKVIGHVGHDITLPCAYDARAHGSLSFCWGRGEVPTFKCSDYILSAEDGAVVFVSEPRYRLLGLGGDGDVSLTIHNVQLGDAGVYGCRVELPGWFNDHKVNTYLVVEEAPLQQPVTQDIVHPTAGIQREMTDVMSTFKHQEGDTLKSTKREEQENIEVFQEVGNICRLAAAISLTIVIIITIFVSWRRPRHLQHLKTSTMENIYQNV